MHKKHYALGIIVSAMLTNCMSNNTPHDSKNQLLKTKFQNNISILNANTLDTLSKTCYFTKHYYDIDPKITAKIADDGTVGGMISSLENSTDSQNTCNYHLYKWQNQFQTIQYANTDTDCSNRGLCTLSEIEYGNSGMFVGRIGVPNTDTSKYFYSDGTNFELTNLPTVTRRFISFSPDNNTALYSPKSGTIVLYDYQSEEFIDLKNIVESLISYVIPSNDNRVMLLNSWNYATTFDYVNNIKHTFAKNGFAVSLKTISNNSSYIYGLLTIPEQNNKFYGIVQIRPNADYAYQEMLSFPFDTTQGDFSLAKVSNDGSLIINQKIQTSSKYYIYSSLRGQFYDFNDLLSALSLDQYISQITDVQLSENGKYMLLVLDRNAKTSTIAVKIAFDDVLDSFTKDNLQPM